MNCNECQEILSAQLDGEAGAAERIEAEHHAAACEACRDYQAAIGQLTISLRRWPDEEPGISVLRQAIGPRVAAAPGLRWWGLAASLILVAGVGFAAGRMSRAAKPSGASAAGSAAMAERVVYPETNEIHTSAALPGLDASRIRLR